MYYKIIINENSLSIIYQILKNISKFYIIINPTLNFNYYIIYLLIDNIDHIYLLQKYNINGFFYNKAIYKIYYYYLQNFTNINNFILIDCIFYNLLNVKIYNKLNLNNYLNLFKLTNFIKHQISNFIRCINNKILFIVHNNIKYLNFICNYIYNYKNDSAIITNITSSNELEYNNFKYQISTFNISKLKYIIIKVLTTNLNYKIINESINLFYNKLIIKGHKLYKTIKKNINILIISNYNNLLYNYNQYVNSITFSKILI